MRTPEDASKLSQQVPWNKKIQGNARSPFQRFKELNRSKCSRCSKPAGENGAKRLELLEPLEHLEPSPFNGLNKAQRLNGLNVLNRLSHQITAHLGVHYPTVSRHFKRTGEQRGSA